MEEGREAKEEGWRKGEERKVKEEEVVKEKPGRA